MVDLLERKRMAFKDHIINLFLTPPTSVCIDCGHEGQTEEDFASLLSNWVDLPDKWHHGAGTCVTCREAFDAEWEAGQIEDPTITVNGEPIIRADH